MEIEEIRRYWLREAAKELGGPAKLAAKIDRSESQVSQLIGKTPSRNFSGELAREFEKSLGKPAFWLERTQVDHQTGEVRVNYDKELRVVIEQWPDLPLDKRKQLAAEALLANVPKEIPTDPIPAQAANEENSASARGKRLLRLHNPKKPA